MTFSEYAQMLNPYLSAGMLPDKFIISLTTQIMDESFFNENTLIEAHPLGNKDDDTLRRIYNGTKPLSRKDAQVILSHLDKARFQDYLSKLSDDVLDLIREAMLQCEITINNNEIDTCTDLFVSILQDCARRKVKPKSNKKGSTLGGPKNEAANVDNGAQIPIPDEYRRCAFCTRWKDNVSIAYKSKTGVPGTCKMYEREQISTDGIDCRYYEPDYGRISCKEIVKPMSFLLQ